MNNMRYLISTDLDGTLLDHHSYQWQAAVDAINLCSERQIPIVFNTSKTVNEASHLQSEIGIEGPMVVENGSGLILPNQFLNSSLDFDYLTTINLDGLIISRFENHTQIIFGELRANLLAFICALREQEGWSFEGFNDWSIQQIVEQTSLSEAAAQSASEKLYSEPFIWNDTSFALQKFIKLANDRGLKVLRGGRFYHLQGNTNKALPIMWLKQHVLQLYGAKLDSSGKISSKAQPELICLGDNQNDIDMLNVADYPICVRSPVSAFPELLTDKNVIYSEGEGPVGWNETILKVLKNNIAQET